MSAVQPELKLYEVRQGDTRIAQLVEHLRVRGWRTRKQLVAELGWDERMIRAVAEAAGAQIIRGQKGFAYFENATVEEINHSANQAISQGKLMIKYGIGLKRQVHEKVGN